MTRMVNAVGDRLLGLLIGRADAGACVSDHGQVCGYKHYDCYGNCV